MSNLLKDDEFNNHVEKKLVDEDARVDDSCVFPMVEWGEQLEILKGMDMQSLLNSP